MTLQANVDELFGVMLSGIDAIMANARAGYQRIIRRLFSVYRSTVRLDQIGPLKLISDIIGWLSDKMRYTIGTERQVVMGLNFVYPIMIIGSGYSFLQELT